MTANKGDTLWDICSFPSPHSGILFLFPVMETHRLWQKPVSVPSFGDSFFISFLLDFSYFKVDNIVSVPSFGDSFFITINNEDINGTVSPFPSPHSGILFLYPEKTLFSPLHNWGFPSPHSGILFLY